MMKKMCITIGFNLTAILTSAKFTAGENTYRLL